MNNKPKLSLGAGRSVNSNPGKASSADKETVSVTQPFLIATPQKSEAKTPSAVQTITLAGTTKSGYSFETLKLGQSVSLVRDPFGEVVKPSDGHDDPNAVSVQDTEGKHIAYLPRRVAAVVSKALDAKTYTYEAEIAKIKGGYESEYKNEMLNWGVDILMKFYRVDE